MDYKHILVGIDFSNASARALQEAARLAENHKAKLHLLHVVDQRVLENIEDQVVVDWNGTISEGERRLQDFVDTHAPQATEVKLEVELGHPFEVLVKKIAENQADLVVFGSRGTSDDPHRLGAVVSKCIRKVAAPILVVDKTEQAPFKRIVCAIDYSDTSKSAVEHAVNLALRDEAELHLIHIYMPPAAFQSPDSGLMIMGFEAVADYPKVAQEQLEKFVAPFLANMDLTKVYLKTLDGVGIGSGIVGYLKEAEGDLLVLGTHGRTGWRSLLLGTTAEHVFHKAPCSTLAIKPADFVFKIS